MLGAVTEHFRLCSIVIMRQILILLFMYILYVLGIESHNVFTMMKSSPIRACTMYMLFHDYNFDSFLFFLRLILHDLKVLV